MTVHHHRLARLRSQVPGRLWKYCSPQGLSLLQTMRLKVTRPKSAAWAYEKEYRSIWPLSEPIQDRIGTVDAHFLPLLPEAIAEVRLGCRATSDLEREITVALDQQHKARTRLWRCRMHSRQYRLTLADVARR